jgi:hypothetical protein
MDGVSKSGIRTPDSFSQELQDFGPDGLQRKDLGSDEDTVMMPTLAPSQPKTEDREFVDRVIASCQGRPGELLGILEQVQDRNPQKYLPADILE